MRIFLTGATGYIGAAVLDALVRGGHDVTALVRDNEKASRVAARGGHPVVGNARRSRLVPRGGRRPGRLHPRRVRSRVGTRPRDRARRARGDHRAAPSGRARRDRPRPPSASSSTRPACGCSAASRTRRRGRPPSTRSPYVAWRPDHEALVLGAAGQALRTIVVRPGIVYGGGQGLVGDLFKSASNGLVRVVGDGNNHWPLVYDRDLADLYVAAGRARGRRRRVPRERRGRRARARHRGGDRAARARCGRTSGTCRSRKPSQDGRLCRRAGAGSGGPQPARARASAGRRRCGRSPATPRACSRSGGTTAHGRSEAVSGRSGGSGRSGRGGKWRSGSGVQEADARRNRRRGAGRGAAVRAGARSRPEPAAGRGRGGGAAAELAEARGVGRRPDAQRRAGQQLRHLSRSASPRRRS